ncbi:MAG: oxygen-independent coproporphyrinogen III oxidase [Lachnospiraceae bacterium]|nr:oxygen-independent coproporphyrinogen III oxidase [Lachnospiraceae bacterium]
MENKSLGIYVHIPFCVKKCDYCDFLSQVGSVSLQERYMQCLLEEIRQVSSDYREYQVETIFIGGGTPSVLKPEWIEKVLACIYQNYDLLPLGSIEITLECNPGTLDCRKVLSFREAGINRISLGLQSADNRELRLLGRIHTWEDFLESAELVKQHFDNWNVDLMSALPGQSIESWKRTLEQTLLLEPKHISAYSLIIEEGTPFYDKYQEDEKLRQKGEKPHILPDEEAERQMYIMTKELLEAHGYRRYEISNYARDGYACLHNERYWKRQDYIGVGLGAASCIQNVRFRNTRNMENYLQSAGSDKKEIQYLTVNEQMEETMYLGLRRMEGVNLDSFYRQFGKSMDEVFGHVLCRLEEEKLLKYSGNYIQLTQKGIDVSNYVLSDFLL